MTKNCTFCYFRLNNHFLSAAKNIKHIDFDVSRFKSDMRRPCPFFFVSVCSLSYAVPVLAINTVIHEYSRSFSHVRIFHDNRKIVRGTPQEHY